MSKRLSLTFYILLCLYCILIITNWYAIYFFTKRIGFIDALMEGNLIYEVVIIVITFFVFKKKRFILPISFVLMTYWLCTMPVFFVSQKGIGAISYLYGFFGFNQTFFLLLSSWLIPIVSLVGCIFWYLDVKKPKSLDKHWSE